MRHRGFILLFGTRAIQSADPAPPVRTVCPSCHQNADIVGKAYRQWFTVFFIPIFPISGRTAFTECSSCHSQFPVTAGGKVDRAAVAALAGAGRLPAVPRGPRS